MRKKFLFILLAIFLIFPAADAAAVRELNGDNLNFEQTEQGQVFQGSGNVELIYDELRITAEDQGIYRRYNGEIEFKNNIHFYYQEISGQAVKLTGNVEDEIFHLIENAQIEGQNSYLEADRIDFYQTEQRIEVKGNAYLEYNNFWAEADEIIYYLDRELITLSGNVKGERNGESFNAQNAEVNQQTEKVKLSGQASLRFNENNSENPETNDSPDNSIDSESMEE